MTVHIEFDTDNAAFEDNGILTESSRILAELARKIENGATFGTIRDVNGNRVGEFSIDMESYGE